MTNEGQILSSTKIYNQNSYPQDLSDRFTTNQRTDIIGSELESLLPYKT